MVVKSSNMVPLGTKASGFSLIDVSTGDFVTLNKIKSEIGTVIVFIRNHCPYVEHIQEKLFDLAREYIPKGISFVAINSNVTEMYPEDSPEEMKKAAKKLDFPFPYLSDKTQEVALSYNAACTPDFFVFDKELKCVYRGQFDESRPENDLPVTGKCLQKALDALILKKEIPNEQQPSDGCRIKWKDS